MTTKYQKFDMVTISRAEIKNADYNPRMISNQAKARLKRGIEENGLVQPLVWNRRTGNLVGGHQRLSILDDLEPAGDFELTVAAIDVPEAQEKRINVLLNNDSTMGHWDERRLLDLFAHESSEVDYEAYGFSAHQAEYFTNLMEQAELENQEVAAAMQEALAFEEEVQISDLNREKHHEAKIERKRAFEEKVTSLMVPQDESQWKLKSEEEKRAYDQARNGFRNENMEYFPLRINFLTYDLRAAFLGLFKLPVNREVIHESEVAEFIQACREP